MNKKTMEYIIDNQDKLIDLLSSIHDFDDIEYNRKVTYLRGKIDGLRIAGMTQEDHEDESV